MAMIVTTITRWKSLDLEIFLKKRTVDWLFQNPNDVSSWFYGWWATTERRALLRRLLYCRCPSIQWHRASNRLNFWLNLLTEFFDWIFRLNFSTELFDWIFRLNFSTEFFNWILSTFSPLPLSSLSCADAPYQSPSQSLLLKQQSQN